MTPPTTFLDNSEWDPVTMVEIYNSESKSILIQKLENRYGKDKKIILSITYTGLPIVQQYNPDLLVFMEENIIYEDYKVTIYYIQT